MGNYIGDGCFACSWRTPQKKRRNFATFNGCPQDAAFAREVLLTNQLSSVCGRIRSARGAAVFIPQNNRRLAAFRMD
jgi:hypothetical protein